MQRPLKTLLPALKTQKQVTAGRLKSQAPALGDHDPNKIPPSPVSLGTTLFSRGHREGLVLGAIIPPRSHVGKQTRFPGELEGRG